MERKNCTQYNLINCKRNPTNRSMNPPIRLNSSFGKKFHPIKIMPPLDCPHIKCVISRPLKITNFVLSILATFLYGVGLTGPISPVKYMEGRLPLTVLNFRS